MTTAKKTSKKSLFYNAKNYNYKNDIYTKTINLLMPLVPNKLFKLYENIFLRYYSLKTQSTPFTFKGKNYQYFNHIYNHTWKNERRVEIPIIWNIIKEKNPSTILEIGNVLSHYLPIKHDVLDKYENGKSVINEDVATYKTKKRYDLIVTISTLEHVGWDEQKKDRMKIIQAVKNLKKLLSPNGKIIFTIPLGYNPYMDDIIAKKQLNLNEQHFLKRVSKDNLWEEAKFDEKSRILYNNPYPSGNAIIVGFINNK